MTIWLTEEEPDRGMSLLRAFSFKDPNGKEWITPAGYKVDGASIPRALWALVGSPYTGDYRRASVVHDKACDDAIGDPNARLAADRMFYHACRAGGCSIGQAILLYIGVRIGAWMPHVAAWNEAASLERAGPRLHSSPVADRIEADFRLVAQRVLDQGEIDDAFVIQRRTEEAIVMITGAKRQSAPKIRKRMRRALR